MDRGHQHGQIVVATASIFSYSSLSSTGMVTGGICGEL